MQTLQAPQKASCKSVQKCHRREVLVDTVGKHWMVEYRGCDPVALDDQNRVEELMRLAAEAAEARVVASVFHRFSPQGVSGVVVIEESHLSIHTWPEAAYAA